MKPILAILLLVALAMAPQRYSLANEFVFARLVYSQSLFYDWQRRRADWPEVETPINYQVFPDRRIEDLDDQHEVFHVLYNLEKREQIPGMHALMNNRMREKGGFVPRWLGVVDESGRVMVAINFNQDTGNAWEHADKARYPASLTAQAYGFGVNYALYS